MTKPNWTDEQLKVLNEVLSWLKAGAPHKKVENETIGFNMNYIFVDDYGDLEDWEQNDWSKGCGSVMCIGGAINQFSDTYRGEWHDLNHAVYLLVTEEVSEGTVMELFYPPERYAYEAIKPEDAAHALEHFIETGKADWNHLEGKYD